MSKKSKIEFEESSGNIFADIGLEDAHELEVRSQIGMHLVFLLKEKKMKQKVTIQISPRKKGEPFQEVTLSTV